MREPSLITITQIKEALFKNRNAVYFPEELERLFAACSQRNVSQTVSLTDIVQNKG
jgi:hypothetical protein